MYRTSEEIPCPVCGRILKIGHTHIACNSLREETIKALIELRASYRRELLDAKRKAERLHGLEIEYHELSGKALPGQIEIHANWTAMLIAEISIRYHKQAHELASRFIRPCDDDRCEFNGGEHPHVEPPR